MKNIFILLLASILIFGCVPKQNIYTDDQLGIQIVTPDNWKPISSAEAGQANIVWEEGQTPPVDELLLGYFDPDTGNHEGTFILFKGGTITSMQDLEDLEKGMTGYDKIHWKNYMCYHGIQISEKNSTCESYTIIKDDEVVSFMIGYSKNHADPVKNILDKIIF